MPEQVWKVKEPGLSLTVKMGILTLMLMCFVIGFWVGTGRPEIDAKANPTPNAPSTPSAISVTVPASNTIVPAPAPEAPVPPVSTVSVKLPQTPPVKLEVVTKRPDPEFKTKLIKNVEPVAPVVAAPVTPVKATQGFNYALKTNGANITGGASPEKLIDGNYTDYDGGNGFGYTNWSKNPPDSFLLTLKDPATLDCVRFLLWDKDTRFYRYKLELCADAEGKKWVMAADFSKGGDECRGWQMIRFTPQTVKLIRLTGTFNSANSAFHVVELQASLGVPQGVHIPQEMDF